MKPHLLRACDATNWVAAKGLAFKLLNPKPGVSGAFFKRSILSPKR